MRRKSLLFAMLQSAAASEEPPRRLRGAPEPRLNGTSSDVTEGASTNITKRAAVSNQFQPRAATGSVTNPCRSRRVSSDEPKPGSRFQRRASAFTTGRPLIHPYHGYHLPCQHPRQTPAPSRTRNLANSAALDPPWLPNATSGPEPVAADASRGRRTARSRRLG